MNESTGMQTIATRTQTSPETISKFEPAYVAKKSRLSGTLQPELFERDIPRIGGKFTLALPDTMPVGGIVVVYHFDENQRMIAETFEVKQRVDGKMLIEQTQVPGHIQHYIDTAVTGEKLGKYEHPTTLTPLSVGDNINKDSPDASAFKSLNIIKTRAGQDYFRVAVATPNSLLRIRQ